MVRESAFADGGAAMPKGVFRGNHRFTRAYEVASTMHAEQEPKQVSSFHVLGRLNDDASAGHAAIPQIVPCPGRFSLQIEVRCCELERAS